MLKNSGFWQSLCIILLAGILVFMTGCGQPQQVSKPAAAGQVKEKTPAPEKTSTEDLKEKAVNLYVDAMMLNDLNEREEALRKLNSAIELDPNFAMAFSMKGDILQDMKKYEDSADAYEQATVCDPWSFKDFFNLGKVCQVIKQWARAAKAYIAACKLDAKHFEAHLGAAQCLYEAKEYDKSLEYAKKANELKPDQPDTEVLLGNLFEVQKDHLQAINSYRRALELEGNDPNIMIPLARAYLRSGRYSSANELLNDVVAMDPKNSLAYQYLGFAQLKLKEIAKAVESYGMAVQVDENDWMAHKGLGVAYMLQSMKEQDDTLEAKAVEQWTISLQIKADQPKLQQLLDRYNK